MDNPLRPARGGFLRPFGCGWFIREYLLGHAPNGSPEVIPETGAPQADIFYYYKEALRKTTCLDKATREEEERARREKRAILPDEIEKLTKSCLKDMPYKTFACRFHSFVVYFSAIQRLGWAEPSGKEEPSAFQQYYPEGPARKFFRLTDAGRGASDDAWSDPHRALYG